MIDTDEKLSLENINRIYKIFVKEDNKNNNDPEKEDYGTPFTICTNCAIWIRDNYFPSGTVMGYFLEDNPTALVGKDCGGHDFLIVDDYLIDFWYRGIELIKYAPIFIHLDNQSKLLQKYYGDKDTWSTLDKITLKEIRGR